MKKLVAILVALLAALLFSLSSQADEREIKSTGGASLGKWKFDEIDPTNALLDFELDGRRLISVYAGYIANNSYREVWRFDNSQMVYTKLPIGQFFAGGQFNERDAPKFFCGGDVEQNCDVVESEKLSRNLIVVKYHHRASGAACAGLDYIDEEIYNEGYEASFGDYYVLVSTCIPAGDDYEEGLALSAHYLSLVEKEGRPIARLSRYDLPKPTARAVAPAPSPVSRPIVKHDVEPGASDARVCTMSTGYGDWITSKYFQNWVEEARKRNLSLEDCERLLKAKAPPVNDPRSLAQEQWDSCSHFPSVELVEITSSGQLVVREKHASGPPNKYIRCISAATYKQILSGRRDARDVVRHAFFTKNPPAGGSLSDIGGTLPVPVKQFDPGQDIAFFYGLEGLDVRVEVTLVWISPKGALWRTSQFIGPTGPSYQWTWKTDRMILPEDLPGLWSVRMSIEGQPAGEYQFQVREPKV